MEKSVSAADANRRFSELLRGTRKGRSYVVTSHGKPVARLVPAERASEHVAAARDALLHRLRAQRPVRVTTSQRRWTREELYEESR